MSETEQQGISAPEQQQPAATVTATVQVAEPAQAQQPAAPHVDDEADFVKMPKAAFNARVESARAAAERAVFEGLGLTRDEITALVDQKKKHDEANKTLEQRVAEREAELKASRERSSGLLETIKQRADAEMALLNEGQRSAVARLAGDDHAAQLRAIDALWPTWQAQEKAAVTTAGQQQQPPKPTPIQTAPAPSAPGAGIPSAPIDHHAKYLELKAKNPIAAARYARINPSAYSKPT
jgi:hypothetical protein